MPLSTCSSCGAFIHWVKTTKNRSMPCDPELGKFWKGTEDTLIMQNGAVVKCSLEPQNEPPKGEGFVPHWVTCPSAVQHRKAVMS